MAKYGNSGGANTGKKYVKLTGGEVATVANERKGRRFMNWYAAYYKILGRSIRNNYDYEVATDTMINVYEAIVFKGAYINNYRFYFLRAYHTTLLKARKDKTFHLGKTMSLDEAHEWRDENSGDGMRDSGHNNSGARFDPFELPAPDFDYESVETVFDTLQYEILEHVRATYDPVSASLFEMYIALLPDTSYARLAEMLGYSESRLYQSISVIKADLRIKYKRRRDFLLSLA